MDDALSYDGNDGFALLAVLVTKDISLQVLDPHLKRIVLFPFQELTSKILHEESNSEFFEF